MADCAPPGRAFIHLTARPEPTNPGARRSIIRRAFPRCFFRKDLRTVAKPELGAKRQCQSCATKFYDLNRDPIICPKCGAIFQLALTRAPARVEPEEDVETEKEGVETVSLDEVEENETAAEAIDVDEDVELVDDADDDTFLEEEEGEDDDVTGLIDGDIESDDEG